MRVSLTTVLDVIGLVMLFVAAFAVDWRLGVAVVGVLLLVASRTIDRLEGTEDRV